MAEAEARPELLGDPAVQLGPERQPANRSLDAAGSIHDDATAERHGFRGGTVAGNVHLDAFPPVLLERFGPSWFERGLVSLWFRTPTTHLEPVRVAVARPGDDALVPTWLLTPEGTVVADGEVGLDAPAGATSLRRRDRRPCRPDETALLQRVPVGERLDAGEVEVDLERQHALLARPELLVEPLDWYRDASPWGPPVACPSVAVDALWAAFEARLRPLIRPAIGLYGAIELRHAAGPLLGGRRYHLSGRVLDVGRSPRTEVLWAETEARDDEGALVASLLMVVRLLLGP